MNPISFMSANFLARESGYQLSGGWMAGDRSTNARFAPLENFEGLFGKLLGDVRRMGFEALDLWTAHLNPAWATPEHIAIARRLLTQHNLEVVSLAGAFGDSRDEFLSALPPGGGSWGSPAGRRHAAPVQRPTIRRCRAART
jgi:hypothetical protein